MWNIILTMNNLHKTSQFYWTDFSQVLHFC